VRLGWTVVPKALKYACGHQVHTDWTRVMTTCFNGASNVVQAGGLACLQPEGYQAMTDLITFYKVSPCQGRARQPPPVRQEGSTLPCSTSS
jgi:LL-diaminopimelate aminotransferase